ncbi:MULTISPECIES: hypothetical protein [unclassified Streptomyces]|uniref:hypothetical protein n=1 Tax=unclassified Streptomyces TaxID=2593676 RepID=UPI003828DC72
MRGAVVRGAATGSTRRCAVRGAGARVRARCTGAGAAVAPEAEEVVEEAAGRGRTGVTRGPVARWIAGAARKPPVPPAPTASGAPAPATVSSTTATGSESEGSPSPPDLEVEAGVRASRIRPVGALSRTACESVPVKEGFCQVASVPEKVADATACEAGARWIGGSAAQPRPPAGATEAEPEPEEPEPAPDPGAPAPEPPASEPGTAAPEAS